MIDTHFLSCTSQGFTWIIVTVIYLGRAGHYRGNEYSEKEFPVLIPPVRWRFRFTSEIKQGQTRFDGLLVVYGNSKICSFPNDFSFPSPQSHMIFVVAIYAYSLKLKRPPFFVCRNQGLDPCVCFRNQRGEKKSTHRRLGWPMSVAHVSFGRCKKNARSCH